MARPDAALAAPDGVAVPPPVPLWRLDDPLGFVFAEHERARTVCALLRRIAANGAAGGAQVGAVLDFLTRDLPLHHADEECDLFPALLRRAPPEDGLSAVIDELAADHHRGAGRAGEVAAVLTRQPAGELHLDAPTRDLLRAYAAAEHRHLAIENGVVLAIARVRLTRGDLKGIARAMKVRRGLAAADG